MNRGADLDRGRPHRGPVTGLGQADYLLENLTSLIRMPPAEDHSSPYELYHKCLVGFLLYQGLSDQEMAETLESSLTFYLKRCTDVMIRKSPAVPLQEPQESDFIHRFLELDDRRNICYFTCHAPFNQQGLRALSECDVVWWVHRAILSQGTRRGERRISRWFEQVHKKVRGGASPSSPSGYLIASVCGVHFSTLANVFLDASTGEVIFFELAKT
ncbi:hypothetical protein FA13DRAFT_379653 [Coprinellus micaceus]|uniref:Uncharacterized protein n=1 Tax=Coprinellus micaceus TaxID=71717 RepID=A0A4Y7SC90_COPMI|nr:hypothetical protein FA13DRAFT_379653 [Coprinellus micaceus]